MFELVYILHHVLLCLNLQQENGDYQLCNGVIISAGIWNLISTVKRGERSDIKYIKDLCIAAFGPEVLASSSIKGTARGGRKTEGPREKKPALDKTILSAIKGNFNFFNFALQETLYYCQMIWKVGNFRKLLSNLGKLQLSNLKDVNVLKKAGSI